MAAWLVLTQLGEGSNPSGLTSEEELSRSFAAEFELLKPLSPSGKGA